MLDKNIFLRGERLTMRQLTNIDIDGNYSRWLNDPNIIRHNSHGRFPITVEKLRKFMDDVQQSQNALVLAIVDIESNTHIGNISLQAINWIDRNTEIAFLLGESSFHGKGIMQEAGKLLIDHAFKSLNLHRVYCGTSSSNIGMQKLALKLGMVQEGIRKEAIFNNGIYHDVIEFGILNKETS